jgi:hypothetical protein
MGIPARRPFLSDYEPVSGEFPVPTSSSRQMPSGREQEKELPMLDLGPAAGEMSGLIRRVPDELLGHPTPDWAPSRIW